jgi:AcrR family transcriptional regulator
VNAAEQLLEDRPFDAISVGDVVVRARSSVGAFYARFADKDALLEHLDVTHAALLVERMTEYSEDERWKSAPVDVVVREVVGFLARYFKEHRGVLRALSLRARLRTDPRFAEPAGRLYRQVPELMRLVISRRGQIAHPSPDLAAYVGFVAVFSTLRERVLFPEAYPAEMPISDSLLADELANAYLAYLGL